MPSPRPAVPAPEPLLTAARSTFEALAFLLAEPLSDPPAPGAPADAALGDGALGARVAFVAADRSRGGTLRVAVSRDVADALAANMLGVARADPAHRCDAVGELANVVCGNVLPLAAGGDAVFHLAAPVAEDPPATGTFGEDDAGAERAWLDVEGGRALVSLAWG